MSENRDDDDEVGYRKPPKHSRFKPGQSGNPKGRPKGRKSVQALLSDTLYRTVPVTEGGLKRNIPAIQAVFMRQLAKALEGDPRATDKLVKLIPLLDPGSDGDGDGAGPVSPTAAKDDEKLLAEYLAMAEEGEDA